jgi:hypothetical protein
LYLWRKKDYYYPENDLLWCIIQSKDTVGKEYKNYDKYKYDAYYYPNETILVTILIKNVYGNTGQFERNLTFGGSLQDTLVLKIKGQFTGKPNKPILYEGRNVLFYEEDKLVKSQVFEDKGNVGIEYFFDGSYCIRSKWYNWRKNEITEYFYKNGILIDTKKYKIDD